RDSSVSIVTLATSGVATIPVSPQPLGIAIEPTGRFLYVASFGTSQIDVVDTRQMTVAAHVHLAMLPRAIAVSPDGRFAYVTHSQSTCSVIDLSRVTGP